MPIRAEAWSREHAEAIAGRYDRGSVVNGNGERLTVGGFGGEAYTSTLAISTVAGAPFTGQDALSGDTVTGVTGRSVVGWWIVCESVTIYSGAISPGAWSMDLPTIADGVTATLHLRDASGATASVDFTRYIEPPDPDDPGNWTILGDASSLGNGEYQLVPALGSKVGVIWFSVPMRQASVSWQAMIGSGSSPKADGFAFVMQGTAFDAGGSPGGGLGYDGLDSAVAVEHDIFFNSENDPSVGGDNHISIMHDASTRKASMLHATAELDHGLSPVLIWNGSWLSYMVKFTPTSIESYYESTLVASAPFDFSSIANADGKVWIGFTASTGAKYASHNIKNITISEAL